MQKDIHPTYFPAAKITCACGTVYHLGSTKESIEVEICGACHPFYTGKKNMVDTAGRVEKFKAKIAKAAAAPKKAVKVPRSKKTAKK